MKTTTHDNAAPSIPVLRPRTNHIRPEWGDARCVHAHFSICKSTLYRLAEERKIRSASLKEKGKLRGKRLFSLDSISDFIESKAKGGEDA